jgi:glycerol-3-phosphate dehydrogenase (NAD(P)+)
VTLGIIGGGAFATALAHLVAGRGGAGEVHLWTDDAALAEEISTRRTHARRLPGLEIHPGVRASSDLGAVVRAARLLLLAVSSPRVPDVVRALGAVADGRHLLVHAIGAPVTLPGGGGTRVAELVSRETSIKRVGVLAGPALARDLLDRKPAAVIAASPFDEVVARTRASVEVPGVLRVYGSKDLIGVELASAISGAMTIALGLADGLGLGPGPRAVLLTRAVAEGTRLSTAAGARERTFGGLAGLGNLLVRATPGGDRSDDYQLGLALARGEAVERRETEGTRAAAAAVKLGRRLGARTPLLDAVYAIVHEGVPVAQAAARLAETGADEE